MRLTSRISGLNVNSNRGLEFARCDMNEVIDAMLRMDDETRLLYCIKKNYETYMEAREEGDNDLAMQAVDCLIGAAERMKDLDLDH